MDRLPPLHALRAFDAVARHRSMKGAAEALGVTAGAVSQLVRGLEEQLGTQLFRRLPRGLALTDAGQAYHPAIRQAFEQIADATRRLHEGAQSRPLAVSTPPAFAAAWLVPRLGHFRAQHPEIDLRLVTSRALANFVADGVDMAIRHGLGRYRGLRSDRIAPVALVPVCSPAFAAALPRAPVSAAALATLPLLHDTDRQDWVLWFAAHGVVDAHRVAESGSSFDDQILLMRAAAAGQGVALATAALAEPEIAAGSLTVLLDLPWPQDAGYWLVCPEDNADQPRVAAFRAWLLAEAGR